MRASQRRQGAVGEREVANLRTSYGIPAKRISMTKTNGVDKGDIGLTRSKVIVSVKRGQHVPELFSVAIREADYLFCRRDKGRWVVVMDVDRFLFLKVAERKRIKVLREVDEKR